MNLEQFELRLKTYQKEAPGWREGVYTPRKESITDLSDEDRAKFLTALENGQLRIKTKAWTETEVTGFGVYIYVNSAVFSKDTGLKDGVWKIVFCNYLLCLCSPYSHDDHAEEHSGPA